MSVPHCNLNVHCNVTGCITTSWKFKISILFRFFGYGPLPKYYVLTISSFNFRPLPFPVPWSGWWTLGAWIGRCLAASTQPESQGLLRYALGILAFLKQRALYLVQHVVNKLGLQIRHYAHTAHYLTFVGNYPATNKLSRTHQSRILQAGNFFKNLSKIPQEGKKLC